MSRPGHNSNMTNSRDAADDDDAIGGCNDGNGGDDDGGDGEWLSRHMKMQGLSER